MELMYIVGIVIALVLLVRGGLWLRDYQRRLRIRLEPVPPGPEKAERFPELGKVRVRPRFSDDDLPEGDDEPALGPVIVVSSGDRGGDRDGGQESRVIPVSAGALRATEVPGRAVTVPAAAPPAATTFAPASAPDSAAALHAESTASLDPHSAPALSSAPAPVSPLPPVAPAMPAAAPVMAAAPVAAPAAPFGIAPASSFAAPASGTLAGRETVGIAAPASRLATDPLAAAVTAASMPQVEASAVVGSSAAAPVEPGVAPDEVPVLLTPVAPPPLSAEQQDMFADQMIAPPPMPGRPRSRVEALYGTTAVEPVRPVRIPESKPHVDIQDVIALHVVSRHHPFNGEDLLRCILSYGLRFGEMSIFHRHERPTGQGRVLFSMAKAVEPGIFDLQAMTGEEIPGVSFFLSLPGVNSIHAYDILVDTAKRLATDLQGEILDEQRHPLTRQLVEHYRERVQEFERRRLMQRPVH
ncbi:MAG: zipA [Moraxellaceae bacterium]|jgi:cell division protein ZipA|nr:zipA [Moraxellaceae bacterium]